MALGPDTIPALVLERAKRQGARPILREKQRGIWRAVSWSDLAARMSAIALALEAAGFAPGEVACVLAGTRPEWVYADLGIQAAGGISAGIHAAASADDVKAVLRDCNPAFLFVENEEQLDKALHARGACPSLRRIVIFDMKGLRDLNDPMCESLQDFAARAGAGDGAGARIGAARADGPAALVYTAGTTGSPKGVLLSHRNILAQVEHAARLFGQHEGDERLCFMPMGHVMERVLGLYLALHAGTISNYVESPDTVLENLQEVRPTVLAAAPHFWERLHSRVVLRTSAATFGQRTLFRAAMRVGGAAGRALLLNVRRELGLDRLRIGLVGGAAVSPDLLRWFGALGCELTEIYGQAECAGLAAAAGRPVPYGEVAIGPDQEVLVRGPHLFTGYWNRPEETARALAGGWLHTGDLGSMQDGVLRIAGRREDVLETTSGLVAAAEIEAALKASPFIADAILFGEGRAFLCCLVMIDHDAVEAWANANDVPFSSFRTLARTEQVRALIGAEIERTLARLGRPERIERFRLIEHKLEPEDPELTPMMKLRRPVVAERYRAMIEEMYAEA